MTNNNDTHILQSVSLSQFNEFASYFDCYQYSDSRLEEIFKQSVLSKIKIAKDLGLDKNGRKEIIVEIEKDADTISKHMTNFIQECPYSLSAVLRGNFSISDAVNNKLINDITLKTSKKDVNLQLNKGMKFSKAISKIMDMLDFGEEHKDRILTQYSQVLNEKKIQGKLVISVNLLDFFTMSVGENWSSCLYPGSGEYSSGTFSYALDEKSFVAYLVSKDADIDKPETNKKWRRLFIVPTIRNIGEEKYEGFSLAASKGYPFNAPELTDFVANEVMEIMGVNQEGIKKYNTNEFYGKVGSTAAHSGYSDFGVRNECYLYTGADIARKHLSQLDLSSGVDYDCLGCGYNEVSPEFGLCGVCIGYDICADCSQPAYEGYTTHRGDVICEGCFDDAYIFPDDDEDYAYHLDEVTWVESENSYYTDGYVNRNFKLCSECDEYHRTEENTEIDGDDYCDECFRENFESCHNCEGVFENELIESTEDSELLCPLCFSDHEAKLEKEKESQEG